MTWWVLVKKEWQESFFRFVLGLVFIILSFFLLTNLMEQQSPFIVILGAALIFFHIFYLFFTLLASLRKEWKDKTSYVWMSIPQPGWLLLGAKFTVAVVQLISSLGLTMLLMNLLLNRTSNLELNEINVVFDVILDLYRETGPWLFLMIVHGAVQLGLAALFIFLMDKVIRPMGWLVAIGISIVFNIIFSWLKGTIVYQTLTTWGPLKVFNDIPERLGLDTALMIPDTHEQDQFMTLYTGEIIAESLVLIGVFLLLSWMLDNKVEAE